MRAVYMQFSLHSGGCYFCGLQVPKICLLGFPCPALARSPRAMCLGAAERVLCCLPTPCAMCSQPAVRA